LCRLCINFAGYSLMKKFIIIWMFVTLFSGAELAFAQVKSDFSDWNVPPPVPPGTINKQTSKNYIAITPPSDVPIPAQPVSGSVKLPDPGPVITTFLNVDAPSQPTMPPGSVKTDDIPDPTAPNALNPPERPPGDQAADGAIDMPNPQAPELPAFPSTPGISGNDPNEKTPKIPVTPVLIKPAVTGNFSVQQFPYIIWVMPKIPGNVPFHQPAVGTGVKYNKPGKAKEPIKSNKNKQ